MSLTLSIHLNMPQNTENLLKYQIEQIKIDILKQKILFSINNEDKYNKQIYNLEQELDILYDEYYDSSNSDELESDEEMWNRLDYLEYLQD